MMKGGISMPPKVKITKEQLIQAGLQLVKEEGHESLHARSLAKRMNISTQPIFRLFSNMESLKEAIRKQALEIYHRYIDEGLQEELPFKGTGKKYIQFAKDEPRLFQFLFMDSLHQDYHHVEIEDQTRNEMLVSLIASTAHISQEEARLFQLETWIFVHGIATMMATQTIHFDDEIISKMLNNVFNGLKQEVRRENH